MFRIILFFSFSYLLGSCSTSSEKDAILLDRLSEIIYDNESWISSLQEVDHTDSNSLKELKRKYFSNYATSTNVYAELSMIVRYFDVDRSLITSYGALIDKRNQYVRAFYICEDPSKDSIEKLIELEHKIINSLEEIRKLIET